MAIKAQVQRQWFGGISDNKFLGTQGSFPIAHGVDVREDISGVGCSRVMTDVLSSMAGFIKKFVISDGYVFGFGDGGQVYKALITAGLATSATWVLQTNLPTANEIKNAIVYDGKIFFIDSGGTTYWITEANAQGNDDWTGLTTPLTSVLGNGGTFPMLVWGGNLFVGHNQGTNKEGNLMEVNGTTVLDAFKWNIELEQNEEPVAFSTSGPNILIYTNTTLSNQIIGSRMRVWDGADVRGVQESSPVWTNVEIKAHITKSGVDYIVCDDLTLYRVNGFSLVREKDFPFVNNNEYVVNPHAIEIHRGMINVGITVQDATVEANQFIDGVWTFGQLSKDYPQTLMNSYYVPGVFQGITDSEVGAIIQIPRGVANQEVLLVSVKDNSTNYLQLVDLSSYALAGSFVSKVFDGGNAGQLKKLRKVRIAYDSISSGETIDCRYITDLNSDITGTSIGTVNNTNDSGTLFKDFFPNVQYNYIQFRFDLESGGSTTTKIREIYFEFEEIQDS